MADTMTAAAPDKAAIRSDLETMRFAYKELVGQIGDANWKTKSAIPSWTCGQLVWHVASSVPFLAGNIEGAVNGKSRNPPAFVMPLLFKLSELRVRIASRKATPASVLSDMDAGMKRMLGVLDATDATKLTAVATSFGDTRMIGEMFHRPIEHFDEHAAHIRPAIGR